MKLLHVLTARAIWLGDLNDLNPKGINLLPIIIPLLVEKYGFLKYPSPDDIASSDPKDGMKFVKGQFAYDGIPIAVDLTIYNDGFVATSCATTVHTDAFLEDMLSSFDETFNMSNHEDVIKKKIYLSELFITTDISLEEINPGFKLISQYLSDNVDDCKTFEMGKISFVYDQTTKSNPSPFVFERASNVPFSEKRYYSIAPLQTHQHLELLNKLEEVLSK